MAKIDKEIFSHIAEMLADNIEAEGEAIKKYQEMLNIANEQRGWNALFQYYDETKQSMVDKPNAAADRKMYDLIIKTIKDYISEEMRHLKGLHSLYEVVTGIKTETH